MKRTTINRWILYCAGIVILALGLTLNTKSNLGVSPIISVAYLFSEKSGITFGDVTFVYYCLFVAVEWIIERDWKALLQIPFSIVFTRFMNLFADVLTFTCTDYISRFTVLLLAIVCTGIGAALTVNMKIVPNPGDGVVKTIADKVGKEMGITKNIFDACCITLTLILGFLFRMPFCGIGIGTVCAMLGVGRVISFVNNHCSKKLNELTGL